MQNPPAKGRRAKLTVEQRAAIAADERSCAAIAGEYGVSRMAVSMIKRGTWGRSSTRRGREAADAQ